MLILIMTIIVTVSPLIFLIFDLALHFINLVQVHSTTIIIIFVYIKMILLFMFYYYGTLSNLLHFKFTPRK